MYQYSSGQLEFKDFSQPFTKERRRDNRWVKMAQLIPWEELELIYAESLSDAQGCPAWPARVAIGALIIKERLGHSDEETVEQIRENHDLQYFIGLKAYRDEIPFNPSLFVYFRKRLGQEKMAQINEIIVKKAMESSQNASGKKSRDKEASESNSSQPENKGKLLADATCTPADITYPTDLKWLNEAREKTEKIIDILHKPNQGKQKKPRTYRKRARQNYLSAALSKQRSKKKRRKAIRKQLGDLRRNLKIIKTWPNQMQIDMLSRKQYEDWQVIHELFRQQEDMFKQKINRIENRIVSISQPHVRPIKRGKVSAPTEFGAKVSMSWVEGFAFVEKINWNNFNEANFLKKQIEAYYNRLGFYPESVHVDKLYRNRENIAFCKTHGIRLSGVSLGRPPKNVDPKVKKQNQQDERDRNPVEGKFGQGKRRFNLSRIMSKLSITSETTIALSFLVMNLEKWLKAILFCFFFPTIFGVKPLQSLILGYEKG